MAKIVIIAPAEADDDIKDAVKMLKAAGHDVDTEEPTPKSLLHIVLGLMGPNAYGFGAGYAYARDTAAEEPPAEDKPKEDDPEEEAADEAATEEGFDDGADLGGDDFNFESLGTVTVDGELIEAVTHDSETSVLCVERLVSGAKTTYALNESSFSFWPASVTKPEQRVEVLVDKHRTSVQLPIEESEGKPTLKVGRDLLSMFEVKEMGMSDELAAKKIFDKIKGESNLKSARVKELVKKYLPMVKKADSDVSHLQALVLTKLQDADLM